MYTHEIKSSKQRCFKAAWWPTRCDAAVAREKKWPMVVTESGQVTRVRASNLKPLEGA